MKHKYSATGQTTVILNYLLAHKGKWVPVWELAKISGSCNSCNRIRDGRARGYKILNRVTQGQHGVKHSEYKLVTK